MDLQREVDYKSKRIEISQFKRMNRVYKNSRVWQKLLENRTKLEADKEYASNYHEE